MYVVVAPFMLGTVCLSGAQGFVAYAYYRHIGCDPFESGQINNPNQVGEVVHNTHIMSTAIYEYYHQKLKSRLATVISNSFIHKNWNWIYKYLV